MKALVGNAAGVAQAPIDRCFALLADVESYPDWYPATVSRAVVIARDGAGAAVQVRAALRLSHGPLHFDDEVPLQVTRRHPTEVLLARVADSRHDPEQFQVRWSLLAVDPSHTRLAVFLGAQLALPPFVPGLGTVADRVAQGFLDAAVRSLNA